MKFVVLILTLIASQGFQWIRLGQDFGLIDSDGKGPVYAAIAMVAVFFFHQLAQTFKQAASRTSVRERAYVVDGFLQRLLHSYYSILGSAVPQPIVRCNVMLPVRRWWRRGYLQIFYKACLSGTDYTPAELDMRWGKGNGVVGWVWSRGQAQAHGAARGNAVSVMGTLSAEQADTVSHLKSVYSVPVLKNGKTVGVLTLDGQADLDATKFDSGAVRDLVDLYARALPAQCFEEGVKAR